MANIEQWVAAGYDALHIGYRNSDGIFVGIDNFTTLTDDDTSGMRRMLGAQTAPLAIPEGTRVAVEGDNTRIATFQFASTDDVGFTLEQSVIDISTEALVAGGAIHDIGLWDMALRGTTDISSANFCLLLTRNAKSQDSGSTGSAGYENLLIMNASLLPIGDDQLANQAPGKSRYSVIVNQVTKTPWGEAIGSANFGVSNGLYVTWFSDNRCMLNCWVADGTEDDFEVQYTPVSASATQAYNAGTGTALTVSAIDAGTKNIALSAAPADGVIVVAIYEFTNYG